MFKSLARRVGAAIVCVLAIAFVFDAHLQYLVFRLVERGKFETANVEFIFNSGWLPLSNTRTKSASFVAFSYLRGSDANRLITIRAIEGTLDPNLQALPKRSFSWGVAGVASGEQAKKLLGVDVGDGAVLVLPEAAILIVASAEADLEEFSVHPNGNRNSVPDTKRPNVSALVGNRKM
jgi:hypothetical protein